MGMTSRELMKAFVSASKENPTHGMPRGKSTSKLRMSVQSEGSVRSMMSRETGSKLKKIGDGMKRIRITREAEKMLKNRRRKEAIDKVKRTYDTNLN